MALPMKKRRPEEDFALLLEPEDEAEDEMGAEGFEDEYAEDDEFGDEMGMEEDPLAAEAAPGLDPEQAQLAETLGFTEPEQQQALIDLIKLVAAPEPAPMEGMEF